jgi:hypothetical protein
MFVIVYSAVSILAEKVALFPHRKVIACLFAPVYTMNLGAVLMLLLSSEEG